MSSMCITVYLCLCETCWLSIIAGPCVLPFCECHIASPIVTAAPIRATAIVMWLITGFALKRFMTQKLRACRPVPVRFTKRKGELDILLLEVV